MMWRPCKIMLYTRSRVFHLLSYFKGLTTICPGFPGKVLPSCSARPGSASRSGKADIVADSAGLLDRLIETALRCPTANIEISRPYRYRWRRGGQRGAVREAGPGGRRLSGQGRECRPSGSARVGYGATQPIAGNETDAGQGAEPPHRFRGEVSMAYLTDILLGLAAGDRPLLGFAMGWISVVQRGQGVSADTAVVRFSALVAALIARRAGACRSRALRLLARSRGLVMFALYLCCCVVGCMVARLGGLAQCAVGLTAP